MTPERIAGLRKTWMHERWFVGSSDIIECLDEIEKLQAENAKLREALSAHGKHAINCPYLYARNPLVPATDSVPCTCGWLETVKWMEGGNG